MKLKKLFAACLAICISASSTVIANATSQDSALPTEYISSTTSVYTGWRYKDDATSHYIYNLSGLPIRVISYSYSGVNRTKNGYAVIPSMSQRFIQNYIRERYNDGTESDNRCRLSIRSNISGSYTTLSGAWSPDSVGNYPIANP